MSRELILRERIKVWTWTFIIGLVLSGATAIPLRQELNLMAQLPAMTIMDSHPAVTSGFALWILKVAAAVNETDAKFPFLAYGMDWLAFGHFVIAVAFIGALRDPVRNVWLYEFGMIACALVVPYALVCGGFRGIPIGWRLIDCSFGVFGIIPVWLCRNWVKEIESLGARRHSAISMPTRN